MVKIYFIISILLLLKLIVEEIFDYWNYTSIKLEI